MLPADRRLVAPVRSETKACTQQLAERPFQSRKNKKKCSGGRQCTAYGQYQQMYTVHIDINMVRAPVHMCALSCANMGITKQVCATCAFAFTFVRMVGILQHGACTSKRGNDNDGQQYTMKRACCSCHQCFGELAVMWRSRRLHHQYGHHAFPRTHPLVMLTACASAHARTMCQARSHIECARDSCTHAHHTHRHPTLFCSEYGRTELDRVCAVRRHRVECSLHWFRPTTTCWPVASGRDIHALCLPALCAMLQ